MVFAFIREMFFPRAGFGSKEHVEFNFFQGNEVSNFVFLWFSCEDFREEGKDRENMLHSFCKLEIFFPHKHSGFFPTMGVRLCYLTLFSFYFKYPVRSVALRQGYDLWHCIFDQKHGNDL